MKMPLEIPLASAMPNESAPPPTVVQNFGSAIRPVIHE